MLSLQKYTQSYVVITKIYTVVYCKLQISYIVINYNVKVSHRQLLDTTALLELLKWNTPTVS